MKIIRLAVILLAVLTAQSLWADDGPSPFSLTYYELYGTPVEPQAYAQTYPNALGYDILAEYNPSYYMSLGINFEQTEFFNGINSSVSFLGLEARFFGAENGRASFAPYVYGGAGVGLSSGTGNQVKAGLGSRIKLGGPVFLDCSAGSNWMDTGLQYLNFRGGLSLSFDLPKAPPSSAPAAAMPTATMVVPTATATAAATVAALLAAPTMTATPVNTEIPLVTATPTQTVEATIAPAQVKADESQVKIYYLAGMKDFDAHEYRPAIKLFKKAIAVNDPYIQSYFYAESNAMLGVIYQFHLKTVTGHNKLAIIYYKRALKIDPRTKSAKKYLAMLVPKKTHHKKRKAKAAPTATDDSSAAVSSSPAADTSAANASSASPAAKTDSIDLDTSNAAQPAASTPAR